jgi:hypothetical protein
VRTTSPPDSGSRHDRAALIVFAAVEAAAFVLFLHYAHTQWFFYDEWDFLVSRHAGSLDDLLRPHHQHWSTLPILVYRVLWRAVGLRSYLVYQLPLFSLHLTAAALLRVVMRRAGVRPWIATAGASLFVLFGSGRENIMWAFQIGFVGSLVFGLGHLLLADHDGRVDWRDWLGIVAGLASLMCSGVGLVFVVIVGLATLMRRGWRVAALHTVPLGACFLLWWFAFARDSVSTKINIGLTARFAATGVRAAFAAMGQVPGIGLALALLLLLGAVAFAMQHDRDEASRRAAAPAALAVGALAFLLLTGLVRASMFGPENARASRFVYLVAALALPVLALAAESLVTRSRALLPLMLGLLIVGVPGNIDAFTTRNHIVLGNPTLMLAFPRVPAAREVPRSLTPDPVYAREVSIGWLLDGVKSGRIPEPIRLAPQTAALATLRLSLRQTDHQSKVGKCRRLKEPVQLRLEKGQMLGIKGGPVRVFDRAPHANPFSFFGFDPEHGETFVAEAGPVNVTLMAANPTRLVVLCGGLGFGR